MMRAFADPVDIHVQLVLGQTRAVCSPERKGAITHLRAEFLKLLRVVI